MTRKENGFDTLARLIKQEGEDIRAEFGEGLGHLSHRMDTGFARVDQELSSIRSELKSFRIDMTELQGIVQRHEGYATEIDHVLQRTAAIEKHLGFKKPRISKK